MKPFLILVSAAMVAALPATGQSLDETWHVLGTFTIETADGARQFHAVRDSTTGDATMSHDTTEATRRITVTGVTPDAEGKPGLPLLTVTLGDFAYGRPGSISVELREADQLLMANPESETAAAVGTYTETGDGLISFTFSAELAAMTPTEDGGHTPVPGALVQSFSGVFDGTLQLK